MKRRVGSLVVMRRGLCEKEGDEEEVSGRIMKGGQEVKDRTVETDEEEA